MITFENRENIAIYHTFINEFGAIIRERFEGGVITIFGINTNNLLATAVATEGVPFATNREVRPFVVVINEVIYEPLDLTPRESHAMISHEIGHLIDPTPRVGNELQREINADRFAVELGLAQDLVSGLRKLINSGNYPMEVESMQKRIEILNDLI